MRQYRPLTNRLLRPAVGLVVAALLILGLLPLVLAAERAASWPHTILCLGVRDDPGGARSRRSAADPPRRLV